MRGRLGRVGVRLGRVGVGHVGSPGGVRGDGLRQLLAVDQVVDVDGHVAAARHRQGDSLRACIIAPRRDDPVRHAAR